MIDVDHEINTARRQVGRRQLDAGEARLVTISRVYDTDIDDLWEAVTDRERIPRWFLPVTGDLHVGGHYQLEGNAGGEILRCEPPEAFDATWEFAGAVSWIEVRLVAETPGRTRVTLTHVMHVDDHWEQYGPAATGIGWDLAVMGLGLHLASATSVDPARFEEWSTSDDGGRFMTMSGDRWGEADIAGGEDREVARAAADRAVAVFTGEAEVSVPES